MTTKSDTTKILILRLPAKKKAELKMVSARMGITMTRFVDEAIERYITELKAAK